MKYWDHHKEKGIFSLKEGNLSFDIELYTDLIEILGPVTARAELIKILISELSTYESRLNTTIILTEVMKKLDEIRGENNDHS